MGTGLAKITDATKSAIRILKAVGPLLISQSEKSSEAYAEHQMRLAQVEATKEFMISEAKSLSALRDTLRQKFIEAGPEERIRLKQDITEAEREMLRIGTVCKALEHLEDLEKTEQATGTAEESEQTPISSHWMDKFNEFARAHNEDWRRDLLARALAMEAQNPGSVGPRALWLIGTIEEDLFHAFASLLDTSALIAGEYSIPEHEKYNLTPIPGCTLGDTVAIGHLTFMLADLGLLGSTSSAKRSIPEGKSVPAEYKDKKLVITTLPTKKLIWTGIITTKLGTTISKLYTQQPNSLGEKIFSEWLENIKPNVANIEFVD